MDSNLYINKQRSIKNKTFLFIVLFKYTFNIKTRFFTIIKYIN